MLARKGERFSARMSARFRVHGYRNLREKRNRLSDASGIEIEVSKKITRAIKDSKLKVTAAIQGDAVRITGAKRDDLQAAMAVIRKEITDLPLSFNNQRD